MLVDVEFQEPDAIEKQMLEIISGKQGPVIPERLNQGMYLAGHWNIESLVIPSVFWSAPSVDDDVTIYGVCDYPEQVLELFPILAEHQSKFFISFVRIRRDNQPDDGGWRWHKWGTYIGNREPKCEYLYDEPEIEEVYTFHIYELKAESS